MVTFAENIQEFANMNGSINFTVKGRSVVRLNVCTILVNREYAVQLCKDYAFKKDFDFYSKLANMSLELRDKSERLQVSLSKHSDTQVALSYVHSQISWFENKDEAERYVDHVLLI